jgi:LPXTG-site transpeptidase (sortase) family protein
MKNIFIYKKIILANIAFVILIVLIIPKFYKPEQGREVILPIVPESSSTEAIQGTSIRVLIPKIGVDASIESVGRTAGGNMAVPRSFETVGWYKYGVEPGELGNAVLAGHLDNGKGSPGVFYHLNELAIGDKVEVANKEGERAEFRVTGIQVVDYLSPPAAVLSQVFGTSTKARLNLITCDGIWIPEKKKYSDRLIVYTERIN